MSKANLSHRRVNSFRQGVQPATVTSLSEYSRLTATCNCESLASEISLVSKR